MKLIREEEQANILAGRYGVDPEKVGAMGNDFIAQVRREVREVSLSWTPPAFDRVLWWGGGGRGRWGSMAVCLFARRM